MKSELQPIVQMEERERGTKEYSVEVPEEIVLQEMESELSRLGKSMRLPGFRKGKAPRHVLVAKFGESVRSEALEKVVSRLIWETLKEGEVVPFFDPEVSDLKAHEGEPVRFRFTVDAWPAVELKKYKEFDLERRVPPVQDEEMEKEIRALQEANVNYVPVDRPSIRGDQIVVSYQRFLDDGNAFGKRIEDWDVVLGLEESPGIGGEIEKGLIGASPGDRREVSADFPEDHPSKPIAGKKVDFHFDVSAVRERSLPPVDDAFASRILGDEKGTEQILRDKVREHLEARAEEDANRQMEEKILESLIGENEIRISDRIVERVTRSNLPEFPPDDQIPADQKEEAEKRKAAMIDHHRKGALRAIQKMALMTEISGRESLDPTDGEVKAMRNALRSRDDSSLSPDEREKEEERMMSEIRRALRDKKVYDWIKENSTVR